MTNFNNNNLGLAITRMLTALAVFTLVIIHAFAIEYPGEPKTLAEFEGVWDFVSENNADSIEIHYSEDWTMEASERCLNNLSLISRKYRYVHPEKFNYFDWQSYSFQDDESRGFTFILTFGPVSDAVAREYRVMADTKAEAFYREAVGKCSPDMTQKERVMVFCEAIADKVEYINDDTDLCHTAYCALENGYAVCDGYTSLLNMLLNLDGIDCEGRLGNAGGGLHEWTYAKLDGEWLNVDVTWYGTGDRNNYVGLTDEELSSTHTVDYTYKNFREEKIALGVPVQTHQMTIDPPKPLFTQSPRQFLSNRTMKAKNVSSFGWGRSSFCRG